jgi:hypothetical protein
MLKKRLLIANFILIIVITIVHLIATYFYLYWTFPWFDIMMHFLGGLWVGSTAVWYIYFSGYFYKNNSLTTSKTRIFLVSIISALIVGVLWEVFEFYVGAVDPDYIADTILDLIMDTLGGIVAATYVVYAYKPKILNHERSK